MADEQMEPLNKEIDLQEKLAIERTKMANDRTFLSFLRTSLYFSIVGLTINQLVVLPNGAVIVIVFWILAVVVLAGGIYKFISVKRKIKESQQHISNYLEDEDDQ